MMRTDHVENVVQTTDPLTFHRIEPGNAENSRGIWTRQSD
jgi:hypothetical protein